MRDRLNTIEAWLESVKADIRSLPWKAREALQSKLEEAHTKLHTQKKRVEQTRAELKSPPELATELLVESVIGWKAAPEAREPHAGPDAAEARAAVAIDHPVASIDEVGDAVHSAAARLPAAGK